MKDFKIDQLLDQIQTMFQKQINPNQTVIRAIYLYGSYIRSDFIKGRSDLDFAVILDVGEDVEHWVHPEFEQIGILIRDLVNQAPTGYFRLESPDICSFSLIELEKAKKNELKDIIGPLKLLTFLGFDFLSHNQLLWGEDILQLFTRIPDPRDFAEERFNWIKKYYLGQVVNLGSDFFKLIASLGSIIRYTAILNGLRSISRSDLRSWALEYKEWPLGADEVLIPYFNFIQGITEQTIIEHPDWIDKARYFIESLLGIE
ncbi:MAG: nucleotidyltransferase domain-containing protein [Candidatus Hodarchaeota archaeon]